jgi:hypothetical protein
MQSQLNLIRSAHLRLEVGHFTLNTLMKKGIVEALDLPFQLPLHFPYYNSNKSVDK